VLAAGLACPLGAQDRRAVTLEVRTVDSVTGEPLGQVLIHLSGLPDRHTTGDDGALAFDAPLGSYRLTARRPGYEILRGDFLVRRPGEFTLAMEALPSGDPATSGRLTGILVDEDNERPLVGVIVSLRGLGDQITNDRGRFVFDNVPAGASSLEAQMLGYADRTESVTIERGHTTVVRFGMSVEAIELEPVEVEVRSRVLEDRGVYRRMEAGSIGRYVTRQDLEVRVTQHLGEALVGMPGVRVQSDGDRSFAVGRNGCALDLFVDGLPVMSESADGLFNLDMFPPEWVEIVEVYASAATAPVEFARSGTGCGVLLIWTRQRY
jgi:hypothetical protein